MPVMAGPGDEIAAGTGDRSHLRASDTDREQVIIALKAAFVQGLLAKDEFDLRVGQALASHTCAELAGLTADLSARLAAAQPPGPARAQDKLTLRPGWVMAVATVLYAGLWAYVLLLSPHGGDNPSTPPLMIVGLMVYMFVVVLYVIADAEPDRREKRSGGQVPGGPAPGVGGQASAGLPSADSGGQLPPEGHGYQRTAEATRRRRPHLPLPVRGHRPVWPACR
jgi:hypothetical protein